MKDRVLQIMLVSFVFVYMILFIFGTSLFYYSRSNQENKNFAVIMSEVRDDIVEDLTAASLSNRSKNSLSRHLQSANIISYMKYLVVVSGKSDVTAFSSTSEYAKTHISELPMLNKADYFKALMEKKDIIINKNGYLLGYFYIKTGNDEYILFGSRNIYSMFINEVKIPVISIFFVSSVFMIFLYMFLFRLIDINVYQKIKEIGNILGIHAVNKNSYDIGYLKENIIENKKSSEDYKKRAGEFSDFMYSILNSINNAVFVVDDTGKIIEWNTQCYRITGIPKSHAIGNQNPGELIYKSHESALCEILKNKNAAENGYENFNMAIDGNSASGERWLTNASGHRMYCYFQAVNVLTESGHVKYIIETIYELTSYKNVENDLVALKNKINYINRVMGEGVFDISLVNNSGFYSDNVSFIFSGDSDNPLENWASKIHPNDQKEFRIFMSNLETHQDNVFMYRHRIFVNDKYVWFMIKAVCVNDKVLGVASDVTSTIILENDIKIGNAIFESVNDAIVVTDIAGYIIKINNSFTEITGYTKEDVIGQKPNVLSSGRHPKDFYEDMFNSIKQNGFWHGEIVNRKKNGELYTERLHITSFYNEILNQTNYIGVFKSLGDVSQSSQNDVNEMNNDFLTGLPTRKLLYDRMQMEINKSNRTLKPFAVCFVDLDNFKKINDQYGHSIGDIVLVEFATRLKSAIRVCDTVARVGGDEFVLLLNLKKDAAENTHSINDVLTRVFNVVRCPIYTSEKLEINITCSVGVYITTPKKDNIVGDIIDKADKAMYKSKNSGKNKISYF